MISPPIERADRILLWLFLATLILGGLATIAVVFSADAVLAGLSRSAAEAPASSDGHGDASDHDLAHDESAGATATMPQDHGGMSMEEHKAMTPPASTEMPSQGHSGMPMPEHTPPPESP